MSFIARAFYNGADGVYIAGCRLNECSYITHGNFYALNMTLLFKRILEYIGVNPERLHIEFMTSSDAQHFVQTVNDFTEKVRSLGPLGESKGLTEEKIKAHFYKVITLIPYIKIAERKKLGLKITNPEEWGKIFTKEEVRSLLEDIPSYWIDPTKCSACTLCSQRCPVDAIDGGKNKIHIIDQEKCIKCGTCLAVCPPKFSAVKKLVGEPVPPPIEEEKRMIVRKQ
ncbi:MAG: hypothetical protein OHK0040_11700 [bacterium]